MNSLVTSLAAPAGNQGCPLCKLIFVPETPLLVGCTTGSTASLIVWNLLTESVWWSYRLTVSALAVDPQSGSIAAAVLPDKSASGQQAAVHAPTAVQPQLAHSSEKSEQDASVVKLLEQGPLAVHSPDREQTVSGTSAVFLFNPSSGRPHLSWSLQQTPVAALLFAAPQSKLYSAASAIAPEGIDPLLIVTEDRQYAIARKASQACDASFV